MSTARHGTPEVREMVRELCEGWQDSEALVKLHGLVQANLASLLLSLGERPAPDRLRMEAVDLRVAADGLAQFLEHLAERIEAAEAEP